MPDISNLPEKIGYLHEIGLNYGYGPTSLLQWTMEHIHIYTGLPWWASIAATAVILRIALFPFYLKASDTTARQTALVSVTKPITDRMSAAQRAGNNQDVMVAWTQLRAVRQKAGINFRDMFTPMILQGVFGFCGFKLLRAMAHLPVPAFHTDGFLWLQDLTLSDPFLILPAVMAGSIYFLIRMGGETGAAGTTQLAPGMQNFMKYGMPSIIFLGTGWQPGAVCVWFAAGGALGIAQALALQRKEVRAFFGLAPIYKPGVGENDPGALQAMLGLTSKREEKGPVIDVGGRGRNDGYTPTYQSPNLIRKNANRVFKTPADVIDVKSIVREERHASTSAQTRGSKDEMIPPSGTPSAPKQGGVFRRASDAWMDLRKRGTQFVRERTTDTPEKRKEKEKLAFKKAAEAYEKRAQSGRRG